MGEERTAQHGNLLLRISADELDKSGTKGDPESQTLFGRMFTLTPFAPDVKVLKAVADQMNWVTQLKDPSADSGIPAGYSLLGAFITHDVTFDRTPLDGVSNNPWALKNHRSPRLDLDSVYGDSPQLVHWGGKKRYFKPTYDPKTGKMRYRKSKDKKREPDDLLRFGDVKEEAEYSDLRMPDGTPEGKEVPDTQALIGDGRNDENVLISQLHLAFLKLHNQVVQGIQDRRPDGQKLSGYDVYHEAKKQCQWIYQWIVVNEFLPLIVGQAMVDSVLKEAGGTFTVDLKLYNTDFIEPPTIPVEFSAAAFRFGHSMIRAVYRVNAAGTQFPLFGASNGDNRHLGGSRRLPKELEVEWARFFDDLEPSAVLADDLEFFRNKAKKIDSYLNELLARLPLQALPEHESPPVASLALRDLKRGVELGLPSGQEVAVEVKKRLDGKFPILSYDLGLHELDVHNQAPLWFYLLREAEIIGGGEQLGPVGGRIVAEVLLGLLHDDTSSYLHKSPAGPVGWPRSIAGLLRLAGVAGKTT